MQTKTRIKTVKLTTAQQHYRTILDGNHGSDVEFIANVIICHSCKPATKLANLLARLQAGKDIRTGNTIDTLRINGEQLPLSVLDNSDIH